MTARRPAPGQPEIGYIEPGHVPAGYLTERPPSPWGSRLVHWAATAAVLAAVVCLVGWPWPTLYALGLLAGASILLAGIRLLLTERREPPADDHTAGAPAMRCCVCGGASTVYENCYGNWFCWPCADCPCGQIPCVRTGINDPAVSSAAAEGPTCQCAGVGFGGRGDCPVHDGPTTADASGQHPETARQHPDATGRQPADQGGDHPGAIRTTLPIGVQKALDADPALRAEYQRLRLMLRASRDVRQGLRDELAALHHGEEPYTDEALVPTPAQWIWRWNHATPAQRLDTASHIKAMADRLDRVEALARRWQDADPLLPGEALEELRDALSDDAQPVIYQSVQAGDRTIRVRGTRVPTPDERRAIAALLDATDLALGRLAPTEEDVTVFETPITPPLTGPMIPTDTPTCGTNLPSTDGIPCAEPAAWHIRWKPGAPGDATFPAGLACHAHMQQLARDHAWYERHEAGPACGTRTANWQTDHCTEAT